MTTIQHEIRRIHNRLESLENSIETVEKDFGELDYFARHNIYSLHQYNLQHYNFTLPSTDATNSKQKAKKR